jgi:phosphopentomutase
MPALLRAAGFPTSGFVAELPLLYRPIAGRIARFIGIDEVRCVGRSGPEVLLAARATLAAQRRGLVFMHWGDADRMGHAHGWMSPQYGDALRRLDQSLGALAAAVDIPDDQSTLLIALADHGGGGVRANDHNSHHPLDRTIPVLLAGGGVVPGALAPLVSLVDVPATVLWSLGVPIPQGYAGRPLIEAFRRRDGAAA